MNIRSKSYRPGGVGMLPAPVGTYLLHVYFDGDQVELVRANVIGWQVGAERSLTPLMVDPRALAEDPWFVTYPDGRVECSDGRCWEDVDTWIGEERRVRCEPASPPPTDAAPPKPPESPNRSEAEASVPGNGHAA